VNKGEPIRIVGDTNFWVSTILGRGLCYKLSQLIMEGKIHHFTSLKLLSELTDVLRRYFGYSDIEAYKTNPPTRKYAQR